MKKLKTISKYNIIFFIILIISFIYTSYYEFNSKYKGNEKEIKGFVIDKYYSNEILTLIIKGKEKVIVKYYNKSNVNINDYIKINGELKLPKSNTIFNMFNYKKYLNNKKIYYIMNASNITVLKENSNLLYKIKNNINNKLDKYKSSNYLKVFILGNKKEIDTDMNNIYRNLGIIHLLSISGSYISLIILVLNKMIKNRYKHIYISVFLLFYIFLTGFQISIIRSSLSYIFLVINKKYNLNIKNKDIVLLIGSLLIIINPFYIYDIGFILSFLLSYSLIYFNYLLDNKSYFKKLLIISVISFFVSMPVIINTYYSINFLNIIFNIMYVPYAVFILFPLSFFTYIFPFLDNVYYLLIEVFEKVSILFNKINVFNISFSKIPLILLLIYYYFIFNKNKKMILLLIIIFYLYNYYVFNPRLYFIDVGQGDSALIRIKNKNILIDTGGNYNYDYSSNYIMLFKSLGVKKIDTLFISHGDFDHAGNAVSFIDNFRVNKVYINKYDLTDIEKEICIRKCIKLKEDKNIKISNINFYILNPSFDMKDENDNSLVINFTLNNRNILFMGDASKDVEAKLINEYYFDRVDILKVGHHGSKTSSSEEFIDEINPEYSIISVGKNNRYGHPNKEVLNNLEDSKIYRTDKDGSIMFKIKNNKLKIETCSP